MKEEIRQRIQELIHPIIEEAIEDLKIEDTDYFINSITIHIQEAIHIWKTIHR